jgi:4-amino-4-deoxy-L-arabinose transferase-like glycosyltransferase
MVKKIIRVFPYLLTVFLRIPPFFEPHTYTDTGIYAAVGVGLNHGDVLYRNIFDNKPPFIYYLYSYLEKIPLSLTFEYKMLSLVSTLLTEFLVYKIAKIKFGEKIAILSTLFFSIFVASAFFEGNVANVENYFMFFTTLSIYLIIKNDKFKKSILYTYLLGIILGLGVMFKVSALLDGFFVIVFFFFIFDFKSFIKNSWFYGIGVLSPMILFLLYELIIHNFKNAINAMFLYNITYVSYQASNRILGFSYFKFTLVLFFIVLISIYFLYKKFKIDLNVIIIFLWFVCDYYASVISGRGYLHYLLQPLVPFSILLAYLIFLLQRSNIIYKIIIAISTVLSVYVLLFYFLIYKPYWLIPVQYQNKVNYYPTFISYITGQSSKSQYYHFFNGNRYNNIAKELNTLNVQNRRIFVMANYPWLYYETKAVPDTPYSDDFMLRNGERTYYNKAYFYLEKHNPYVIVYFNDGLNFVQLFKLIDTKYTLKKTIAGVQIYIRKS